MTEFPQVLAVEVAQLIVALVGAGINSWALWDAYKDVRLVRNYPLRRVEALIAHGHLHHEMLRGITQLLLVVAGIIAVTTAPPPPTGVTETTLIYGLDSATRSAVLIAISITKLAGSLYDRMVRRWIVEIDSHATA